MINKGLFTNNSNEWATPRDLFIKLDDEFHFVCDLCASDENALLPFYFTQYNSCFYNDWYSVNFCNPPYTSKFQDLIFLKVHNEALKGNATVMLVPARTDTKRFHDIVLKYGYEVRFLKGMLKFGNAKNSAPFPSMIIIFKNKGVGNNE